MEYTATILDFNFSPMVSLVKSTLKIQVTTEYPRDTRWLEKNGTIEELSEKFEFEIVSQEKWDFTGLIGRKCRVFKDVNGEYHFLRLV